MFPPRRNNRRDNNSKKPVREAAYPLIERIEARLLMTTVYAVTDLGNLGGGNTAVAGINDSGKIVGSSDVKSGVQHPFLYANGKMTDLGVPAGFTYATAVAINARGDVLILASNPNIQDPSYGPLTHAFLDIGGVIKDIGLLSGFNTVTAAAFNNSDTVVGDCAGPTSTGDVVYGQFIYKNGSLSTLSVPGGVYGINDAGVIVGSGFIDSGGVITMLQTEGDGGIAIAINAAGNSTGYVPDSFGDGLALFTPSGALTDVPFPGETTSGTDVFAFGESINNANVVVGSVEGLPGFSFASRAIIEQNGAVQDLNNLIDPADHITLMDAPGINNNGIIVATTSDGRGLSLKPQTKTLGTISGTVFNDGNGDGVQQPGESGLAGQTVYLDRNANGQIDPGEPTTVTNSAGHYSFSNLWPGTYAIGNVLPNNAWKQTAPANNGELTVTLSQSVTAENFGEQQLVAYTVTDLSSFPSGATFYSDDANAINASGQIAGDVGEGEFLSQAAVFSNGTTKDLSVSAGEALGINDSGEVVGYFTVGLGVHQTTDAFSYYNGKFTNLGTLSGDVSSVATAVNDNGEIVGYSNSPVPPSDPNDPFDFPSSTSRGFVDINGKKTAVDPASQMNLFINALNNKGVFVGSEETPGYKGPATAIAFISVDGKVVDLDPSTGSLNAINNLGQAVGVGFSGAIMYYDGKTTQLTGLDNANGINDAGTVVGTTLLNASVDGAIYIGGKAIDLNDVVPTGNLTIDSANAINASGWIAASGVDANNNTHALLLKPVLATVSGSVFWDKNSSGAYQPGDTPLAGRQVYVDIGYKGHYVAGDPTALTDANGNYTLTGVPTGGCLIRQVLPGGWYQTTPAGNAGIYASAGAGANFKVQAFGEGTPANLTISGEVFNDLNASGGKKLKDPGIAGVTVYIDANNNGTLDSGEQKVVTGADGSYSFNSLLPGTYVVRAVTPSGFRQTTPLSGGGNTITLTVGRSVNNAYFGETAIKSI